MRPVCSAARTDGPARPGCRSARRPRTPCAPACRRRPPPSAAGRTGRARSARRRCRAARSGAPTPRRRSAVRRCGRRTARSSAAAARCGAGDDEQARAAGVEAVDDARSHRVADVGELAEAVQQPVDQRPVRVAGTGVDDQPGRLVDDDDVVVLEDDLEARPTASAVGGSVRGMAAGSTSTERALGRGGPCPTSPTSPSTRTPPAAMVAAATERLTSASRATTRSRRSPASAARDALARSFVAAVGRRAGGAGVPVGRERAQHEQHATDRDGDVGDVEDRPPLHVDEVDRPPPRNQPGSRNRRSMRLPTAPPMISPTASG